jgi:MFS family permease
MEQNTKIMNLGLRGWLITICCFLLFFVATGVAADFLNISVPALSELRGWDMGLMLAFSSIAGWVTLATSFIAGNIIRKVGPHIVMIVCTLVFSVLIFFYGTISKLWLYGVVCIMISVLDSAQNGMSMQTVISRWFPRKKGVVMGIATIGLNASTVAFLPFFAYLNATVGITSAYRVVGAIAFVVAILCTVFVRDLPEELGIAPDNDAGVNREELEAESKKIEAYIRTGPWTIAKLLRTKQTWQIPIILGIGMMTATGVLTQFIVRAGSLGIGIGTAILILSVGGILTMPFSYLFGFLDARIGSKKITSILLALYIIGLIVMIFAGSNVAANAIGASIFFVALGGINNMMTSYTTSVFGRYDFTSANRIMYPIYTALRCSAFIILGISVSSSGGYTTAYIIFAVCCVIAFVLSLVTKDDLIGRSGDDMEKIEA